MIEPPSPRDFLIGWCVQNIDVEDPQQAPHLAARCRAAAQERGLDPDTVEAAAGGDLTDYMVREIAAFAAAEPERELSRDD